MRIQLSEHFTYRKLLRFTLPSVIMMVCTSIYGVVDGVFVSNFVGSDAFAAVNLIMPFLMVLGAVGFMLGTGGSALVAYTLGAGNEKRANEIFSLLIYVLIGLGAVFTIGGIALLTPMSRLLGADETMLPVCVSYGRIVLLGLIPYMLQNTFQSFLVTAERPQLGLYVTIAAGVTNIVLDALFVAVLQWSADAFAAVNLIMPFLMVLSAVGFMLGTGGSALVAYTLKAGNEKRANEIFSLLIYVLIGLGAVFTIGGIALLTPMSRLLGADETMLPVCVSYGRIVLLGLIPYMLQNTFQSFLVTAERPQLGLYVTIAAGVTNIVLDALFVAVLQWGVEGAALATILSQFVGGVIPLVYFLRPNSSKLRLGRTAFHGRALLKACANGSSEFMTNISMSVVNMLYNWQLMRLMGSGGVAVYGVIMYVNFIFIAIFLGYSMGSAPIVGYHYGAGNRAELRGLLRKSLCIITVMSVVLTAAALLLARPLSLIFMSKEPTLLPVTIRAFSIYSLSFLMAGYNIYASSFFTALNDGFISALISFARTLVFQVAAVTVLPVLWDIDGVWAAVVAAETLALLLSAACLVGKRKKYGYA